MWSLFWTILMASLEGTLLGGRAARLGPAHHFLDRETEIARVTIAVVLAQIRPPATLAFDEALADPFLWDPEAAKAIHAVRHPIVMRHSVVREHIVRRPSTAVDLFAGVGALELQPFRIGKLGERFPNRLRARRRGGMLSHGSLAFSGAVNTEPRPFGTSGRARP